MEITFLRFLSVVLLLQNFSDQINADKENKIVDAINSFGLDLYKELTKTNDNLACSGFSASTAFNMLLAGARKKTEKELRTTLHYNKFRLTRNEVQDAYHKILTNQRNKHNGYDLCVANSMWIKPGFPVLPEFKDTIKNKFYAEEQEVDFASPEATNRINSWVSTETKQKIPKLFDDPLDPSTRLVLVNAIYFKGTWKTQFNESLTEPHPFRSAKRRSNSENHVQMMNVLSDFPYSEDRDLKAQILELPYDGDDVSMVVVLPKAADGLSTLQGKLRLNALKKAVNKLSNREVDVRIPKFEISSTLPLNDVLKRLGVKAAFSPGADLSGINGKRDLSVSKAIQKAIIEVNEKGTVAAASTGIGMVQMSAEPETPYTSFTADHPFLYFIRHKPTGLFLFMGRMTHPEV